MNKTLTNPQPMTVLTNNGGFEYTPRTELGRQLIEIRNKAVEEGMKLYSADEILKAMEEERAGYDGLGRLWSNEKPISTQM
jgi:hypothetical protein